MYQPKYSKTNFRTNPRNTTIPILETQIKGRERELTSPARRPGLRAAAWGREAWVARGLGSPLDSSLMWVLL